MKTDFIGYPVSNLSKDEIITKFKILSEERKVHFVTVMNANKMYLYDKYELCRKSVNESAIILPENAINIGMKWLSKPMKQWDVGGVEIAKEILLNTNLKVFLLGAKKDVLEIILEKNKDNKNIVGTHDGYFSEEMILAISQQINDSGADVVLLGLGSPKQEVLMQKLKVLLSKGILVGVGGTFDVLAGKKKDAPRWTKRGFEWIYRAFQDPKKFKRYLIVNSYFMNMFVKYKIHHL
jgi:N-acetylglucosaminyldiphosphoundecaprenol N-acetyl-beta-D-mannosaminyltransferase